MENTHFRGGNVVQLTKNIVQVWYTPLRADSGTVAKYLSTLSEIEIDRLNLLFSPKMKKKYTICHGVLRNLLGMYLNVAPHDVLISTLEKGKPVLLNSEKIQFSISTSGEYGVFVFSQGNVVGIDIEKVNTNKDLSKLIKHSLSDDEKKYLNSIPEERRSFHFYSLWTRKEALLKAMGTGIDRALDGVNVPLFIGNKVECEYYDGFLYSEFILESRYICTLAVNSSFHENIVVGTPELFT